MLYFQDRDDSTGSDSSVKKRRGEEDKHKDKNGVEEKRKVVSDRKRYATNVSTKLLIRISLCFQVSV